MEALHQPGDIIAKRYRITGTLGQGGVGITYAAEDLKSGQQVALKALSLRQMGEWKVLELFEREARILAQLNHPAIPRYLDYFQVDSSEDRAFYIAQELVEGKSLADLVKDGWRTNESGVRQIATQVLEILVYLHSLKPPVVHRDIKPQNLILGKDGKIFLVDFGAVQDTYRSTFAKGSTIIGTYGYMAPEQFRGQAVPATDLYGLGATVLFLLTHRSPSDLPQERLKFSFRSRIQVSEGFADWLEKMLEPDVEDRFTSAKEALAALQGRMVVAKTRAVAPWKALVGVGVVAVAAVTVLNSFKWAVLGTFGFQPSGMCESANSGNIAIVRDYLKRGGNPTAREDGTGQLLDCLLDTEHGTKYVAELVNAKLLDVNARDRNGKTLLHMAVYFNGAGFENGNLVLTSLHFARLKLTQLLIAKGADVHAKDNQGQTPLHSAYWNSKEVAQLLIAKGADVHAKDNDSNTPLHMAAKNDSKEVAQLLIAKGADVHARDNYSNTPLHFARSEVELLLIAKGADVHARNNQNQTPLHRVRASKEVVQRLIAKGADVYARDNQGRTPLHFAGSKEVAELLIAKGADVHAKDNQGRTPLHLTLSEEVAQLLIAKGADVHAKDNQGRTPLHLVGSQMSLVQPFAKHMIELLVAKGADVNARDNQGRTPLHLARWTKVRNLLIAKGADVTAKDNQGRTWYTLHINRQRQNF
jgi:ankyrin repeat protein